MKHEDEVPKPRPPFKNQKPSKILAAMRKRPGGNMHAWTWITMAEDAERKAKEERRT